MRDAVWEKGQLAKRTGLFFSVIGTYIKPLSHPLNEDLPVRPTAIVEYYPGILIISGRRSGRMWFSLVSTILLGRKYLSRTLASLSTSPATIRTQDNREPHHSQWALQTKTAEALEQRTSLPLSRTPYPSLSAPACLPARKTNRATNGLHERQVTSHPQSASSPPTPMNKTLPLQTSNGQTSPPPTALPSFSSSSAPRTVSYPPGDHVGGPYVMTEALKLLAS